MDNTARSWGGNKTFGLQGGQGLAAIAQNASYDFYYLNAQPNAQNIQKHQFKKERHALGLNSMVLLPLAGEGEVRVNGQVVVRGEVFFASAQELVVETQGPAQCLIAGVRGAFAESYLAVDLAQIKRVQKPWGHELWYSGEGGAFAFKQLFLACGERLSLQYHERKRETLLLHQGEVSFYYYAGSFAKSEDIDLTQIKETLLLAPTVIDIAPMTVHRLRGISSAVLFEVSTPELDDVVRVQDDSERLSGRVEEEHTGGHA